MPSVSCKICGKKIHLKPGQKNYGEDKYCSKKCEYLAQMKGKPIGPYRQDKKMWKLPPR